MFDFLRRAREAPAKEQPPGLEQFNSANVASAVRKECLTHPATILPAAGSLVTLGWTVFIAASPASVALAIGCLFVSGSALIWNYVVNGESRVNAHYAQLMADRKLAKRSEFSQLVASCQSDGFERGGNEGRELQKAFDELVSYIIKRQKGNSFESFRFRAEAAFEQGCSVLQHAYEVFKAMETVDLSSLESTVKDLESELERLTDEDDKAMQKRQIDAHKKQVDFYHKKEKQLRELLTTIDEIESALQTTYMGLLELGSQDPTAFLSEDGGAAQQLVSAFDAAKRVEARLRGGDSAADKARMQEYMKAAE